MNKIATFKQEVYFLKDFGHDPTKKELKEFGTQCNGAMIVIKKILKKEHNIDVETTIDA